LVESHETTEIGRKIQEGVREGVRKALLRHKRAGQSIATMKDGKIVWIPPQQIPVEDGSPSAAK